MQTNQTKAQQMAADLLAYRTHYAALCSVIGTRYGMGDGSTTFNVPNLCGRVPVGADSTYPLASMGDEAMHTLTEEEIPSFSGNIEMHNSNTGTNIFGLSGIFSGVRVSGYYRDGGTRSGGANSYDTIDLSFGGDEAHNNMQPYMALNYIIKA